MLTKQDLKHIKQIVRDEIVSEAETTKTELRSEIKLSRITIQEEIRTLAGRVKNLEQHSKKMSKKLDEVVDFFDKEHLDLVKRTKRIETHLNIQPLADF